MNHRPYEIRTIVIGIGYLQEGPAPEAPVVVHGRHPERASVRGLGFLLLLPLAGHFEYEIERIVLPVPVIDLSDEARIILALDVVD